MKLRSLSRKFQTHFSITMLNEQSDDYMFVILIECTILPSRHPIAETEVIVMIKLNLSTRTILYKLVLCGKILKKWCIVVAYTSPTNLRR